MFEVEELKRIVDNAKNVVFFGGAGVSTESGIPDFRGNNGLYAEENWELERPEAILSAGYLYTHPRAFFSYYKQNMLYPYAEPNDAHIALARLEEVGKLSTVITQNIDGLHQRAGSKNVIELHGSVLRNYCCICGKSHPLSYITESVDVPMCKACGGMVRPDVTLYGESLNNAAFHSAEEAVEQADVMIVGGTSLTVYPAASLVENFEGEHLIIVNRTPTPYDEYAELVLQESVSEVLRELI